MKKLTFYLFFDGLTSHSHTHDQMQEGKVATLFTLITFWPTIYCGASLRLTFLSFQKS